MEIITYTEVRNNFKHTIEKVCADHAPVFITRKNGESVVMMSLEDYNSWEETLYLVRSKVNKKRLIEALEDIEQDIYQPQELIGE